MRKIAKIVGVLAALPAVVYATAHCYVASEAHCVNVFQGMQMQYAWQCYIPELGEHTVYSAFSVAYTPTKPTAALIEGPGSAGIVVSASPCTGVGQMSFFTCPIHGANHPFSVSGWVLPFATGVPERISNPDNTQCP